MKLIKILVVCVILGLIGSATECFFGVSSMHFQDEATKPGLVVTVAQIGALTGFIVCFFVTIIYLRLMQNEYWDSYRTLGSLFGAFAGAVSNFVTAAYDTKLTYIRHVVDWNDAFLFGIVGAVIGALFGFILSLILKFIFKSPDN